MTTRDAPALAQRISRAPRAHDAALAQARYDDLVARTASAAELASLRTALDDDAVRRLLLGTLGCSPYLSALIDRHPEWLQSCLVDAPDARLHGLTAAVTAALAAAETIPDAMRALRLYKGEVALLTALADLAGAWDVPEVTGALSLAADTAVQSAVRYLFRQAASKGDWLTDAPATAADASGYIVLGMGKYGARELNYSSDIDLIIFYELEKARLRPGLEAPVFFVRLTRDLVKLLQETTVDGYVFRTDLRLRPDAGATQVALSTIAALDYYESCGQNWERAAMIKARAVAGDLAQGQSLLAELAPFIWRKYLDFAAIADIHAMKRQIHAFKGYGKIGVAGHNIKVGRGGIREIEFFAQTQQLIAGGRQPDLRTSATLTTLARLTERGWLEEKVRAELEAAYLFLRKIEHRLQMLADEQTQVLPTAPDKLDLVAAFSGFETFTAFAEALTGHLERVQTHYGALFEDVPELTRGTGNMVFAGEEDDPATVETLARMGFTTPATVIKTVRGWHHGRYAAVRTPRARERLTEVQPLLVEALARTANPDLALASFDKFLAELPTGVQLFSLLRNNPGLLQLIADIMGSAPRLAGILSRRRRVFDAVLDPGFFGTLPSEADLETLIETELAEARDYQERLDRARVVGHEQAFLIGVRVLSGTIAASAAGGAYALLAEKLIAALLREVERELATTHGRVPGGAAVVVAMGKLGGREMTAASDLDLIVVYDFDEDATQSDGSRPLAPSQYYARLTQRLISALAAPTAEGALYEVDMRLRPSGQKGPVATRLASFVQYQDTEAWTWEHMALTRARVLAGPPALRAKVEAVIAGVLSKPRERARIAADVRDMRERIFKEKGTRDVWELKQVRGGLVDLEFIAQYLQLVAAAHHPAVLDQNTQSAFLKLREAGVLAPRHTDLLIPATRLVHNLTQILRLCLDGPFHPDQAPEGLKALLARVGDAPDFARLQSDLAAVLGEVAALYDEIVV
ncbi:MAG: bifunctional [glutamine synthetase] adenylyltransferase/[glutamine synthetase]-adenylyl-L-tyrosine phosphorylase [Hyphomicrobiaceae bacterium]